MKLTKFTTIGGIAIYRDELGAVLFKSGCTVNADGSPHAYAPDASGLSALDYLANAGEPGNWWGIACDDGGTPYVQAPYHQAPGFYVSTTALTNPQYPGFHPNCYVDSERYCFGVLPGGQNWAQLGDVGLAYNVQSGDAMYYALADIGPKDHIGEGSMLLTRCLGLNPSPKTGGTAKPIIAWMVLPKSDPGYADWEIKCQTAMKLVENWGGLTRLKQLASEL
jgi:hypothetical protein